MSRWHTGVTFHPRRQHVGTTFLKRLDIMSSKHDVTVHLTPKTAEVIKHFKEMERLHFQ